MSDRLYKSLELHKSLLWEVDNLIYKATENLETIGFIPNSQELEEKIYSIKNTIFKQGKPKNDEQSIDEIIGEPNTKKKCKISHDQS